MTTKIITEGELNTEAYNLRRKAALQAKNRHFVFCIERACCKIAAHGSVWCKAHRAEFADERQELYNRMAAAIESDDESQWRPLQALDPALYEQALIADFEKRNDL
jgi:hypothetical protein